MTVNNKRGQDDTNPQLSGARKKSGSFPVRIVRRIGRMAWYLCRKTAYVAFLLGAVGLILIGLEKLAELALWKSPMSYVYPKDFGMTKRNLTMPVSHYDYDLSPGVCLIYNQEKGNRYEYANNAGFRDPRDISLAKPDDEFRIFLTGGSTAFGLGAAGQSAHAADNYYLEHRETISRMLEKILNASAPIPEKKIRVYNTAVWGYAYQHLFFRYPAKLRQYKPDMVISLDGANEIHPISIPEKNWNYFNQGQFHGILQEIFAYSGDGLGAYLTLWLKNNTFLMAFIWRGMDPFFAMETGMRLHQGAALAPEQGKPVLGMTQDERSRMVAENADAVVRVVDDYHTLLKNDGVRHLFALQPMLYLSKKPRHEVEKRLEAIEEHKQYYDLPTDSLYKFLIERITENSQQKQYLLADFSEYFDDTSQWVFTDWCHLTAGANYLLAKELASRIKQNIFQRPLTDGDKVEDKDSFFSNPTADAKVVYAPPSYDPQKGPEKALTGYPGFFAYSSRKISADEKLELVLDLGKTLSLGRLRLVWEDGPSVPSDWAVDVSRDGKTWKEWVRGSNKELDSFTWWPGYEYYAADPVQAQYLRYRPIDFTDRSIGLRCLSATR